MTTQHIVPARDIKRHYAPEYFEEIKQSRKGFLASVDRTFSKLSSDSNHKVMMGTIMTGLGLALALPYLLPAAVATTVTLTATLFSFALGAVADSYMHVVNKRDSDAAMERDIKSGKLVDRYLDEVLKPQQKALQDTITALSSLPAKNVTADHFNASGSDEKTAPKGTPTIEKKTADHRPQP